MSNNPGYAKGHAAHVHDPQARLSDRKQRRRDVASGKVEPVCLVQTWNFETMSWDKSER